MDLSPATASTPPNPSALALCGRYLLDAPIGLGGMADVYRGRDETLDRAVAVKVFRAGAAGSALRQQSEMHVLSGLHHPNLVALWDAGSDSEGPLAHRFYLVMELIDGPTLSNRIAAGPLPAGEVADLGAQLADALAYIHERGIVHRDIKPANVLLAGTQVKLTDFGIARIIDGTRYTDEGATIGTPDYLAPEQVRGGVVGVKADIYALGLILIEALTGERCYTGTPIECAMARLSRPPAIPAGLHDGWQTLLAAMTATEPAERPDAAGVAEGLRAITRSGDFPTVLTARRPRPIRRRVLARALVAAALAIGAGTAATILLTGHSGGAVDAEANTATASAVVQPDYPAVDGDAGHDLALLESHLSGLRSTSGARLRADALTAAQAFLVGNTQAASAALAQLRSDLASGQASGDVPSADATRIARDIDALFGDLSLIARPLSAAPSAAASTPPQVVKTVTVTEQVQGPVRTVQITETAAAPQPPAQQAPSAEPSQAAAPPPSSDSVPSPATSEPTRNAPEPSDSPTGDSGQPAGGPKDGKKNSAPPNPPGNGPNG